MAARRLILVMLALLVLSSIAAALIPVERDRLSPRETSTTRTDPAVPAGTFVHRRISAEASRPARIPLEVGDQLELVVTGKRPGQVEIPAFGEFDDVDPDFPARFDLLALEPGDFAVRLVDRRTIARIDVAEPDQAGAASSNDEPGSSNAGSTSGASSPS
jgi:hypothetical protein